jgi:hypothetical protein
MIAKLNKMGTTTLANALAIAISSLILIALNLQAFPRLGESQCYQTEFRRSL